MEERGAYLLAAPAQNAPPQSGLRPASSPEGGAFNLPLRGRGTAAVGGGGRGALRKRAAGKSRVLFLPLSPVTPLLSQGFALPAPPKGELLTFPSGEGGPPPRAVAVRRAANLIFYSCRWQLYHNFMEEGPCASERLVSRASFSCRSRSERPSSVRASPCQHHFLWYSCHRQLF